MPNEGEDLREELRTELRRGRLRDGLVDSALDYVISTNPLETVLRPISECDEDGVDLDDAKKRVTEQVDEWLDSYEDMLREGRNLPVDLIARAGELAKVRREESESTEGST